jgi:hypothetical protein
MSMPYPIPVRVVRKMTEKAGFMDRRLGAAGRPVYADGKSRSDRKP